MLSGLLNVRSAAAKQAVITAINLLGLNLPHPLVSSIIMLQCFTYFEPKP
jgi:hypothetical protein